MAKKKKLLITGSEGLIGKKLCKHFLNKYEIIKLDKKLGNDLTDEKYVKDWFKKNSGLYAMIVCHAYNPLPLKDSIKIEPIDVSLKEIRDYMEVNVVSAFNMCRHFISNNETGVVVNISSLYGRLSPKHHVYSDYTKPIGYSMSKSALMLMSKYLATYYAPKFRINTVILGGVHDDNFHPDFYVNYTKNVPMGRMMNIEEVTSVFDFLLDEKSSYITGTEIVVDGGWTSW
jgi:NAD(P)-dependent dehydrogenase (short-subunit alcohol dehydrogenase family)